MRLVRNGVYSKEIKFRKDDQLHEMADSFNEMVTSLEIRKEIDLFYIERIEKIMWELTKSSFHKSPDPELNRVLSRFEEISSILGELKDNKIFVYDEDPKNEPKNDESVSTESDKTSSRATLS